MLDALLLLALELLLHVAVKLSLLTAAFAHGRARFIELFRELGQLRAHLLVDLHFLSILLSHGHGRFCKRFILPVLVPVLETSDDFRLCQATGSRLKHAHATLLLQIGLDPCAPPAEEVALCNASHSHLLRVLDALLPLYSKLLLELASHLFLRSSTVIPS